MSKYNAAMYRSHHSLVLCPFAGIKLAPEILEPEPIDIQDILHRDDRKKARRDGPSGADGVWSGEATRSAGFNVSGARGEWSSGGEDSVTTVWSRSVTMGLTFY